MELALSLGDSSKPFPFLEKTPKLSSNDLGFFKEDGDNKRVSSDPPLELHLLPRTPPSSHELHLPWLTHKLHETSSSEGPVRGLDVNRLPLVALGDETEEGAAQSSPNSAVSSFHVDFGIRNGGSRGKRNMEGETERGSSRASDDDDNGSTRKKLRLSKQQSAFLEESFKEHNTLNPKQKLGLAKQLNLRPRQVEVWFQNRRARTKLKQTEIDCEYLKRCCETLTEENRRLQKELQELRALKTSQPFYMNLPATTLTMCPSCERVVITAAAVVGKNTDSKTGGYQFPPLPTHVTRSQSPADQAAS